MEDVADALYMAAAVLLLIIALSVSISSLKNTRDQMDQIIGINEVYDLATDEEGNYINYITGNEKNRKVGAEAIMSSIRKMNIENYKIYIIGDDINNFCKENKLDYNATTGWSPEIDDIKKLINWDLYSYLKGKTYIEEIGVYRENKEVSDANNKEHRIITYTTCTITDE